MSDIVNQKKNQGAGPWNKKRKKGVCVYVRAHMCALAC